jgi:hypothetical protein
VSSRRHQTVKSNHHKGANEPTAAWEGPGLWVRRGTPVP